MNLYRSTLKAAAAFAIFACISSQTVADEPQIDFTAVLDAIEVPDDIELGKCSGVGVDKQGRIFLLHRGKRPVLSFDKSGKFLRAFGDDYVATGHGLKVDQQGHVWVTCTEHHMVYKFNGDGKLLFALGQIDKPGTGSDPPQFDQPTDVAIGPQGEIYVADGYGNSRMVKFSPEGKFLATWGQAGEQPGQFHAPHQVVVDSDGQVIVADRDNNRLQVFDGNGKFLKAYPVKTAFGVALNTYGVLFACSGDKVHQLDKSGSVVKSWGQEGSGPLEFGIGHQIAIDQAGNLYVAEVGGKRLQKLQRHGR
ncbi:Serine/threonine-protein kinase PknD [Symmachiella macrocystis]|uniref:Serine/threonine-protein kinase PknD n=1 Tax=Symmachiella macrocystis TaxID=2527985 RepID=A0A5C6BP41_9PLAN|nr:peptidyl-alpha-hydroxyglycine alpha-amidating lyase family protein [Symmachiella macrocystis]TWU12354.1 Serine/threonine-protein kinase PknD [Symmachiella macrocystis]